MTEDVKRIVEELRKGAHCGICDRTFCLKPCKERVAMDNEMCNAADLIEQLTAELEQVKRERDAAIRELHNGTYNLCLSCKHCRGWHDCEKFGKRELEDGEYVGMCGQYEWCGPCEENGGAE